MRIRSPETRPTKRVRYKRFAAHFSRGRNRKGDGRPARVMPPQWNGTRRQEFIYWLPAPIPLASGSKTSPLAVCGPRTQPGAVFLFIFDGGDFTRLSDFQRTFCRDYSSLRNSPLHPH
jgi:hypothetical protein